MVQKCLRNGVQLTVPSTKFKRGNRAAATHGLRSAAIRAERRQALVQEVRDHILQRWTHLADQEPLLSIFVDCLCDVRQARDWLDLQGGPLSAGGRPFKAVELLRARERDARDLAAMLLITPRDMARLGAGFGLATPRQKLAEQAHARLLERYAPESDR